VYSRIAKKRLTVLPPPQNYGAFRIDFVASALIGCRVTAKRTVQGSPTGRGG
jgi:hypothetical protein